jgi:SPP1 family predicted phage head-tail adaptor
LRERVTLEAPLRVPDGAGGADIGWSEVATLWARVETRGGGEVPAGERLEARRRLEVTIRFRADVTPAMRLVWRGAVLDIRAVADSDGRRRFLTLDCVEGGA